jgi:putative NADH-flavin reductase
MNIAVFGATGGTGREFTQQALDAGHEIRALVRTPSKLNLTHDALTVLEGDVLDADKVAETVSGAGAVVISLGNTANNPEFIVTNGTKTILNAMQAAGVTRVVAVSSIGVGDSKNNVPFAFRMMMKAIPGMKHAMEDKEQQEAILMASDFDWIIVRPGGLVDEPAKGNYKHGLKVGAGRISRADVGAFVLKQLTDDTYLKKAVSISG